MNMLGRFSLLALLFTLFMLLRKIAISLDITEVPVFIVILFLVVGLFFTIFGGRE